ncbi:response regulator [Acetobacter sicerae]|uniref:histidine kinase n=1 Tax=Acetobacter sicerae TaxID=85325 RepID=A0ABS8VV63_9PROT|nr:ATP-binding protein [Acetobacter sicerae]MCE0744089.1 response regulator [Acetobacter sicerae]NHN91866.1 response regulator [Acetobacter sicerae]
MARHPAKRAHVLALLGAALLIVTFGTLAMQLGNEMARHGQMDRQSASADQILRSLDRQVEQARICRFAWLASHDETQRQCFHDSLAQINVIRGDFPSVEQVQERLNRIRPASLDQLKASLDTIANWQASDDAILNRPETDTTLSGIDEALISLSSVDTARREGRLADMLRNTSWQKRLDAIGIIIGVLIMVTAGWILDRTSLAAAQAEARSRNLALQLRAVLDSLAIGVAVFGTDGQLRHWNDRLGSILGLDDGFLRQGLSYEDLSAALVVDCQPLLEPFTHVERAFHRGQSAPPVMVECKGINGADLELCRTLFFASDDGLHAEDRRGFVLTANDITLRLRSERALGESQKLRAVGQLTAGIAHDFKNLLTVILGNIELATEASEVSDSERRQHCLDAAAHAARRSEALTGQLLSFTRRDRPAPDTVALADIFSLTNGLLARVIGPRITVECGSARDIWHVQVNPAQLESALLNLAINARDAMPGGGQISICASNASYPTAVDLLTLPVEGNRGLLVSSEPTPLPAGAWVKVDVTDDGCGMGPEVLQQLFEPFFTTKDDGEGTGLGMAMVVDFCRQAGGRVVVASAPGHGTCVSLWLPRALTETGRSTPDYTPATTKTNLRALVVEDDPAIRDIVATILGLDGYRVTEAADGEAAFDLVVEAGNSYDLLVTDIQLPGPLDGFRLARLLRERLPELGIVCMSGDFTLDGPRPAAALPIVQLLPKPFRREGFLRTVAAAMQERISA